MKFIRLLKIKDEVPVKEKYGLNDCELLNCYILSHGRIKVIELKLEISKKDKVRE